MLRPTALTAVPWLAIAPVSHAQAAPDGNPGAYTVLDLYAHCDSVPGTSFNFGLLNLIDRRYRASGDIVSVLADSDVLDRCTSPGRNLSASITLAW